MEKTKIKDYEKKVESVGTKLTNVAISTLLGCGVGNLIPLSDGSGFTLASVSGAISVAENFGDNTFQKVVISSVISGFANGLKHDSIEIGLLSGVVTGVVPCIARGVGNIKQMLNKKQEDVNTL